ncbi:MAG: cell division transport system ATP-binding protein [Sphingobacteriales bacterium]
MNFEDQFKPFFAIHYPPYFYTLALMSTEGKSTLIDFKNVVLERNNIPVLENVNFSIEKGEFVYLIGKTGSGKSSLLKALYAELSIAKGTGTVCGFGLNNISNNQISTLRRSLGIVFQDFQLLTDRPVKENLEFVLNATGWKDKQAKALRMKEVMESVGLGDKMAKYPHQLSGGEQQRVSIARALLNKPSIILADEPTGNLDPETTKGILDLLAKIAESGTAIIMATHDYSNLQKMSTRTLKCEEGTLRAELNTENLAQ